MTLLLLQLLAGLVVIAVLHQSTANRLIKKRLRFSAFLLVLLLGLWSYASLYPPGEQSSFDEIVRMIGVLALVSALVPLSLNPFRHDRASDRFPGIVQDALVVALFALVCLYFLGHKVLAISAVGGVVVGLALQDTLGNMFAGLAIQMEKPFRVGHWIQTGKYEGMVLEISWRATRIRTKDNNYVVIPNGVLSKESILNFSEPTLPTRLFVDVSVSYDDPPNRVKQAILEVIGENSQILRQPEPDVLLLEFGNFAVAYRARFWITDYDQEVPIRDQVRTGIYYSFRRHGIHIPLPMQVQIHRFDQAARGPADRVRDWKGVLSHVDVLAPLSEREIEYLAETGREQVYGAGETIVQQGDPGDSLCVIREGRVRVQVSAGDAGQAQVESLGPGEFFGEMALLTGEPRSATVVAETDCSVLSIKVDEFRNVILANPSSVEEISRIVARRLQQLQATVSSLHAARPMAEASGTLLSRIRHFFKL